VRLHLGDSFDVTARKRQTEFHFLPSPCTGSVSSYEIALANAKPVVQAATWLVHVPPDGRTILDYTARVTWCS
jgi:hypothetical protein